MDLGRFEYNYQTGKGIKKHLLTVENDRYYTYHGDLHLSNMGLKSLFEDLPIIIKKVNGSVYVWGNKLKNLDGIPQFIKGNLNCAKNKLKSLDFGDWDNLYIGGDLDCSYNKLKRLFKHDKKAAKKGRFAVRGNINLSNNPLGDGEGLSGLPNVIYGNLIAMNCNLREITHFCDGACYIGGDLELSSNSILTRSGMPEVMGEVKLKYNPLLENVGGSAETIKERVEQCSQEQIARVFDNETILKNHIEFLKDVTMEWDYDTSEWDYTEFRDSLYELLKCNNLTKAMKEKINSFL